MKYYGPSTRMSLRHESKPRRWGSFAASLAPIVFLAGCSGQSTEAPPPTATPAVPAEKPAATKSPTRQLQPDDPGYSGKGP